MSVMSHLRAGSGQPILFIHGIGGAARMFQPQIDHYAGRGFEAIACDLPGYGGQPPLQSVTFNMLCDALETLIDGLSLDRPVLVGHSLGGMIVQSYLRRHPQAAAAAVLSGTSPAFGNPNGEFQRQFLADRLGPLDAGHTMPEIASDLVAMMVGEAPDPEGLALATECLAATPPETYRAMMHCLVSFDERENLAEIAIPVLCLAGEHDHNAPALMMQRMAERIPGARYHLLAGAGHLANVEQPEASNAAIDAFLDELAADTQQRAQP